MRIIIYSRKSKWTGKGESVENQITMCREYIERFIEGSENAEISVYEDEGFSGKNTNRPQFKEMMKVIKQEKVDYLVCYKLDRLGRNLVDLASLMETLENLSISFVSIKEKFDTSTPIGKAMLLFSGVLAQMEREQIAERVRDNMIMLARSGRWLGGNTPLGFVSVKQERDSAKGKKKSYYHLQIREEEIHIAKSIFDKFSECQSLNGVLSYLQIEGKRTRNGKEFAITTIRDILTNPVYCRADKEAYDYYCNLGCQVCIDEEELDGVSGLMSYAKTSSSRYKSKPARLEEWIISKGRHKGILSGRDFINVQRLLERNKIKGETFKRVQNPVSLLSGLIFCKCGHSMRPKNYPASRLTKEGERTFAYLCTYKDQTNGLKCDTPNVHGNTLDDAVCREVLKYVSPDEGIIPLLKELKKEIADTEGFKTDEREILKKDKDKKKRQIQNLVTSISNIEGGMASDYILSQIDQLDQEVRRIDKRMEELENNSEREEEDRARINELINQYSDFYRIFPSLSVVRKREFLEKVLKKVVWDGEFAHIYLKDPVHDKHRVFCRHLGVFQRKLETKFPQSYHRIPVRQCLSCVFLNIRKHNFVNRPRFNIV